MKTSQLQQSVSVALSLCLILSAVGADAGVVREDTGRTLRKSVEMMNRHYQGERPTARDYDALAVRIEAWAERAQADGRLAAMEAHLLAHASAYTNYRPVDAAPLHRRLARYGYQGSKESIQEALDQSTRKGRIALVEQVRRYGMYATVREIAQGVRELPVKQARLQSGQLLPVDFFFNASCADWGNWGADLMALGGIALVFGQEEAALTLGGVGGVIWLYSRYVC